MLKYVVAMLCAISLSSSVYLAGWGGQPATHMETTHAAKAIPVGVIDVKNTKCIVQLEDIGTNSDFFVFEGKAYHICCSDCEATFKKEPEKFIKALTADPAKFGVGVPATGPSSKMVHH